MLVKNILLIIWDKYHNENSTDVGHTLSLYIRLSTRLFPSNLLKCSNSQHVVGVRLLPYASGPSVKSWLLTRERKLTLGSIVEESLPCILLVVDSPRVRDGRQRRKSLCMPS